EAHYPVTTRHEYLRGTHYRGEITRVVDGDGFAILSTEIGAAYHQVSRYRRDLIHLRPGIVLTHDVYAPATELAYTRWVMHSRQRPELIDPTVEKGSAEAGILRADGARFGVARGDSRLDVTLLTPQPIAVRAIGGEGYEDYVDGRNYAPLLTHQGAGP